MRAVFLLAISSVLMCLGNADASYIVFTDRAAFNAATTNLNSFDFSGEAAIDSFAYYNSPPGFSRNGVNFQSTTNRLFIIGRDFAGGVFSFTNADFVLQDNEFSSTMNISLNAGTRAFAFDAGFQAFGPADVNLNLSTGESLVFSASNQPLTSFFGLISSDALTSISLSSDAFGLSLANFASTSTVVPVPGGLVLGLFGIIALSAISYFKKKPHVKCI